MITMMESFGERRLLLHDLLSLSGTVDDVQAFVSTTISSGPSDTRRRLRHSPLDLGHGLCSSCVHINSDLYETDHRPLIPAPFRYSLRLWQVISHELTLGELNTD